jgi:uncharacterized RDD family membrane protein YckC
MTYGYPPPFGAVTGEAVTVEMRPARLGSRTVAFLLDLLVQLVLFFGLTIAYFAIGFHLDEDLQTTLQFVLLFACALGYPIILETIWGGRTLGKAALGIRVVRDDGGPAPFTAIVFREVEGLLLDKAFSLGIVGISTMMASADAKRLGDMMAGTRVVSVRVPGHEAAPVLMPPPLAGWASTVDLSRVPDSLGLAIRAFLARAPQLDAAARERVGAQLVAQLAAVTSPPPPPGTPGWAFLTAILAERRRRDEQAGRRQVAPTYVGSLPEPAYGRPSYGAPPAPPVARQPPPPPAGPGGFSAPV